MAHLLAIGIGPVQEFIAAARTTRDLWHGSTLLSQIARAVAGHLQTQGAELIFPSPAALADPTAAVANKVLALIESADPAAAAAAARQAGVAVLEEKMRQVAGVLSQRSPAARQAVDWALLEQQAAQFVEFYSAWTPLDLAGDDYPAARRDVERLLAGRKALRDFEPPAGSFEVRDGRPKSALDPSRESVILTTEKSVARQLGLRPGEHLDGVSLIKRLADAPRFVSVARVAMDPLIRRLEQEAPARLATLNDLADRLRGSGLVERFRVDKKSGLAHYAAFPYDTLLMYDDVVDEREIDGPVDPDLIDAFQAERRQVCRDLGLGGPPAYYAVLHADGDRMGRAIATLTTRRAHQEFSKALADFAGQAGVIVAQHQGALVYSGGDDVLAFLPLDGALACADALRKAFVARVQDVAGSAVTVSLSVGLAIVHFSEPLLDALAHARAAEADAKQSRNALGVALHTRTSGSEVTRLVVSWDDEPLALLSQWVAWHRAEAIPDSAAYELRALALEIERLPLAVEETRDLLRHEVARIVQRKRADRGQAPLTDVVVDAIGRWVGDGAPAALLKVVNALLITRRLAEVAAIAGGRR